MRFAALLLVTFAYSGAFASEPGQPLDCSDWVFLEPGLSCRMVVDPCGVNVPNEACFNIPGRHADNSGGVLEVRQVVVSLPPCPPTGATPSVRIQITRLVAGTRSTVAYLQDRCGVPGTIDQPRMFNAQQGDAGFEPNYGRMYIGIEIGCNGAACESGDFTPRLFAIEGFTTTFDVLQTYTLQSELAFRVPYMPEGMAAADHFDTYWGPLTKPLDFAQAQPLQCDYPATPPHVGDYLVVADSVPTPTPGSGVYYVTAATYQGTTRYGRKTTAGHLSGRDPTLLPVCLLP
jgi:hypothetical protein